MWRTERFDAVDTSAYPDADQEALRSRRRRSVWSPSLLRVGTVYAQETSKHTDEGLVALVLTAQGGVRSALSNLKAAARGAHFIINENGCHMCDQPHRAVVNDLVTYCEQARLGPATALALALVESGDCSSLGNSGTSIRVYIALSMPDETLELESSQLIGAMHMCIADGVSTQSPIFYGSVARLCAVAVVAMTTS